MAIKAKYVEDAPEWATRFEMCDDGSGEGWFEHELHHLDLPRFGHLTGAGSESDTLADDEQVHFTMIQCHESEGGGFHIRAHGGIDLAFNGPEAMRELAELLSSAADRVDRVLAEGPRWQVPAVTAGEGGAK